jgi:hypothetical protein
VFIIKTSLLFKLPAAGNISTVAVGQHSPKRWAADAHVLPARCWLSLKGKQWKVTLAAQHLHMR